MVDGGIVVSRSYLVGWTSQNMSIAPAGWCGINVRYLLSAAFRVDAEFEISSGPQVGRCQEATCQPLFRHSKTPIYARRF